MVKSGDRPSIESVTGDLSSMDLKNSELEAAANTIQAKFRTNQEADIGMKHEDSKAEEDFVPDPEIFKVISLKDGIYEEVVFSLGISFTWVFLSYIYITSMFLIFTQVGLKNYWSTVNHIALVVSDIGKSLGFYAGTIGMTQVLRPDFDR